MPHRPIASDCAVQFEDQGLGSGRKLAEGFGDINTDIVLAVHRRGARIMIACPF